LDIRRRRWSIGIAFAAALMLLLQSALGAFAAGPDAAQLDAFGNVICTHEGAVQLPGGDPHQQHMPACCMLGCSMASVAYAPPPGVGLVQVSLSFETVAFVLASIRHPDVTRERMYLETMERILGGTDKIILDSGGSGSNVVPFLPLNELTRPTPPRTQSQSGGRQ